MGLITIIMVCVCIVPVRRVSNDDKYRPSSYEVCFAILSEGVLQTVSFYWQTNVFIMCLACVDLFVLL